MIATPGDSPAKLRVIVDTDPGVDDAMTFAFLQSCPQVTIEAFTTVFGNGGVAITSRNAAYLAQRFGITAPVFAGADVPLQMPRRVLATHVHGYDGLGGTGLADDFRFEAPHEPAHSAIARLIRANPGEISILAIGPLTNLALALREAPEIAQLAREVVVMGGAFGYGGRRGNVSPVAEANVANDPHAAEAVLGAAWPVTMVGLDVTTGCILSSDAAREVTRRDRDRGQLLWDISRNYEQLYRDYDGVDGCCIHDVAAAVRLVAPGFFASRSGPVHVVTEGIAIGETIQKADDMSFPPSPWDGRPSQTVCVSVDADALVEFYVETLAARSPRP